MQTLVILASGLLKRLAAGIIHPMKGFENRP